LARLTTTCTRCIMDTSDPDISFDRDGVCNHCRRAEQVLATVRWTVEASRQALASVAERIRRGGVGLEYDSIIGLSGGVDSSYVAVLAHQLGLRPLAVHLDNGWDSELAVENIQRIVEAYSLDLVSVVIDWREFRDLQRAFLRASVVDIELLTDHAIFATMVQLARRHRVRHILSGNNVATEHGLPQTWIWNKQDWTNIRAIHAAYGSIPLKTYPHLPIARWRAMQLLGQGVEIVELLNLTSYRRDEAAKALEREVRWREYGAKHHESVFTRFYQGSILPLKFGIDKRRVHLSDRIRNGELTRAEALAIVATPPYQPDELRAEGEYVRKKLGFDEAEWNAILATPSRPHTAFATSRRLPGVLRYAARNARRVRRFLKAGIGRPRRRASP
jgi:N-acetyl sugar amidotransferase